MTFSNPSAPELVAALVFGLAVIHTFSIKFFANLARVQPKHAGVWHLLSEVEVVFGLWAFLLVAALFLMSGREAALDYLEERTFTEPMFVFVIMVVAASRPILEATTATIRKAAAVIPLSSSLAMYFLCLAAVPLAGSLITEPAAMTLAAILLRDAYYAHQLSARLQYATIGVLFVNVSIGGTLTNFAAPPVLMVASTWQWDTWHMISEFGWKAAIAVLVNAGVATWLFRTELVAKAQLTFGDRARRPVPALVTVVHLLVLTAVVFFAHHPVVFMGLFLFFLGFTEAYKQHQDRLMLREGLLVAFFLAGLVTLGGLQTWWLQPALTGVDERALYFIATALTAIADNAALTYLGSLVEGLTPEMKYALVAGAVTGGGLTVIANAPNPAGFSILRHHFRDEAISPLGLLLAAIVPTCVAVVAFQVL